LPRRNPLASTAAYSAARATTNYSAPIFATLVDFTEVGDMAVFIDEGNWRPLERRMRERGYLERKIWQRRSYVAAPMTLICPCRQQYLLGKEHIPLIFCFGIRIRRACPRRCIRSIA